MMDDNPRIESLPEFLAHALELEHESASRYQQLADSMTVHHNQDAAALFQRLAAMSDAHAAEVAERARGIELPRIPPWEFKWNCPGSPETDCLDAEVSYLMSLGDALRLALFNERRGQAFYAEIAATSPDAETRCLAREMAAEEATHLSLIEAWIARADTGATREDLDPPNSPE